MAYWMRVFCAEGKPPPLEVVFDWVAERGIALSLDRSMIDVDPSSPDWEQAAVFYRPGKLAFLAELTAAGEEVDEEVEEFSELLEDVPEDLAKSRIQSHLARASFIIANQIPTSDFEEDGYNAVGVFMQFFVEHNDGLVQADGEGFYEGQRLVLPLD